MNYKFRRFNTDNHSFEYFELNELVSFYKFNNSTSWKEPQLFTGSNDMNNTPIYEGDVLEFYYSENRTFEERHNTQMNKHRWTFVVTFQCGCLGVEPFDKKQHNPVDWDFTPLYDKKYGCFIDSSKTKIIGNIFSESVD